MTAVKDLLNQVEQCELEPQLTPGILDGLLKAVQNYQTCPGAFGDEKEQPLYRMAVLAEIRNLFSQPAFADALADIDPDDRVNDALLEDAGAGNGSKKRFIKPVYHIKSPFCNDRYTHKFVDEWYAERRYAIGMYGSIVVQLPKEGPQNSRPHWVQRSVGWVLSQGVLTDFVVLSALVAGLRWYWLYPALAVAVFVVGLLLCVPHGAHRLKALVPRLAACVIVGLVPALATQDVWKFSFHLWEHQIGFWTVIAILLLASWLYLFVETHNHVGKDGASAHRAFHILLRLCNFALFFSWWATSSISTIAPSLVERRPAVAQVSVLSQTLTVPLPTCILFAAFAVFIGIFLQILWHDRPITSRL